MGLQVRECVELFARLHGNDDTVASAIEQCGLDEVASRRWRTLSGGEQQRLSLAVALVGGSELIVLDEPTAALDIPGQERVLDVIADRSANGSAVLLTTHRLDEVEKVADRVVILHQGRLVANSTVAELTEAVPEIRLRGMDMGQAVELEGRVGLSFAAEPGGEWVAKLDTGQDPQARLSEVLDQCSEAGLKITSASVGRRSLADAYRELVS